MTPDVGVRLTKVTKAFGHHRALAGIDLEIPQGSYVALMGHNGAGKSSLLKVIAGLSTPTAGTVTVAGVDLRRAGPGLRALVGFVAHETMLYSDLTVLDNLMLHARLYGVARPAEAAERTAARLSVNGSLHRRVRTLSRGMRQRVTIARALLHGPRVLLLDEPYTGLDEDAAARVAALLRELHTPERVLVVAVHELTRAFAGADRLVALERGAVALDRPIHESEEELARTYLSLLADGAGVGR